MQVKKLTYTYMGLIFDAIVDVSRAQDKGIRLGSEINQIPMFGAHSLSILFIYVLCVQCNAKDLFLLFSLTLPSAFGIVVTRFANNLVINSQGSDAISF